MPSRIRPLRPGDAEDEATNDLLRQSAEGWYEDTAYFGAIAHRPVLLERLVSLFEAFPVGDRIEPHVLELMRLKVAQDHQCAYCGTVRTAAVRDEVAPKERALFDGDLDSDVFSRRERLAVEIADQLSRNPQTMSDEFFDSLRETFTDEELVELLLFASLEVGLDRFCIALRLDTDEESPYPTDLDYPLDSPDPRE